MLGWLTPPRISVIKMFQTEAIREAYGTKHVAQDMLVPMTTLTDSMNCMDEDFACYPLWLCPMLLPGVQKNSPASEALVHPFASENDDTSEETMIPGQMYVDIGAYGSPRLDNFNAKETLPRVEKFVLEHKGFQALYADSLLSREDFYKMFDHSLYYKVREKYGVGASFPEIYDKVSLSARI